MLSLPLLAARSRLLRAPAASIAARSLGSNANVLSVQFNTLNFSKNRAFSTNDGSKNEEEDQDGELALEDANKDEQEANDDGMSPLERLLQHSQQFQLDMDQDDDSNKQNADANDPFADDWQEDSTPMTKSTSRSSGAFKRNTFRRRGNSDRHVELGRRAADHLIRTDVDDIDYDSELESVWDEEQLKQRKFHQALRRELDKDRVCTNCGEPGHRSRNCLVPRICSNCGNLGHTAHQCRYKRNPVSMEEFLVEQEELQQKRKKNKQIRKIAAKAVRKPGSKRPEGLPTTDLNKRNESLRGELDAELDAYADLLESMERKRKNKKKDEN
ncbi:Gag polyprotein [Phytophthora citrophthora]|uniref:Gag polyprotein n=1 Tax=Phytophthora citrophthora TaxID=4793 RepID=A0AAD9GZS8_9STRA|nr:Gag polyprotein [Phytophthora citrophthora]